jgi:predicted RNase H-like nuclease (RuvC/YqgF family)
MELKDAEMPEIEIAMYLNSNAVYRDLYSRVTLWGLRKFHNDAASPPAKQASEPDQTQEEYDVTKKLLERLEQNARDMVRDARRIELKRELNRLTAEHGILTQQLASFEKEVEQKRLEAESMGKCPINIQMQKAEIENIERILHSAAQERERLRLELDSPPRITVWGDPPAAVPENPD